jgi:uncharacterized protein YcbX
MLSRVNPEPDDRMNPDAHVAGEVVGLWRYPVKSMLGEELNATEITEHGVLGDRQFAVIDASTGKVAGAKNPRLWANFLDFRAAYVEPLGHGGKLPAVRVTLPDGSDVTSDHPGVEQILSGALGRGVGLAEAARTAGSARAEEYWPDLPGLDHRDTVTEWDLPAGTFFDWAIVHLLTTATIDHLRGLNPQGRFEARRFRPNIVVCTGPDAQGFVENDWITRTVTIGSEVRLRITGGCPRCVMVTLPQGDLPGDPGILRTAQHNQYKVGVYADVIVGGRVRRGDPVTVV